MTRLVVGLSGASGAVIGARVVSLIAERGGEAHLVASRAAERTFAEEIGAGALEATRRLAARVYDIDDVGAAIASGSFPVAGMIVAPCSMRSLSAIAYTLGDNLLTRAADVNLKERRPLVLIPREAPLHLGHLKAMIAATEAGAILLPPVPAFYHRPQTVEEIVDQIARRALDLTRAFPPTARAWTGAA